MNARRFGRLAWCGVAIGMLGWGAGLAAEAERPLRIIVIGAHPDDAEFRAGGAAIKWARQGHAVKMVSMTNGDIGHWKMAGGPLALRRKAECAAASKVMGTTSEVLDIHDGEFEPTLENRKQITRLIREWQADIVISHRPWDYHPDHRYVGMLVQDAAFMVTVPFFCPDTPALDKNPLFLFTSDNFQKPYPFQADVAIALDEVFETKVDAVHEMASQTYEGGVAGSETRMRELPPETDVTARKAWLRAKWERRQGDEANRHRAALVKWYGDERGKAIRFAEVFEVCEYGRKPTDEELRKLMPF